MMLAYISEFVVTRRVMVPKKSAQVSELLIYNGLQQLILLISELPENVKNE